MPFTITNDAIVFGYVVGAYGAMICTYLMKYTSNL